MLCRRLGFSDQKVWWVRKCKLYFKRGKCREYCVGVNIQNWSKLFLDTPKVLSNWAVKVWVCKPHGCAGAFPKKHKGTQVLAGLTSPCQNIRIIIETPLAGKPSFTGQKNGLRKLLFWYFYILANIFLRWTHHANFAGSPTKKYCWNRYP